MKIAYIANTPDSRVTGIAKIMNSLAAAVRAKGHTVDLIFSSDVFVAGPRRLKEILFGWMIIAKLKRSGYDLVAIHSMCAMPYVFMRHFLKSLPPCVVVSYGSDEMRWDLEKEEEALGFQKRRLFSKVFYGPLVIGAARFATKHADAVMVAAKSEIAFNVSRYGMDASKIAFVPNGVVPDYFSAHDYSRPVKDLLFFGGWEWRKGTKYLVQTFSELAVKYPHLRLTIAGIGASEKAARAAFPESLQSRITVHSSLSESETPAIYARHDIFVFPSLFESMSLVVPEAMASGLPVVTTRACGMQDIIEDGKTGFLVPPRDAAELCRKIELLIQDQKLRASLGTQAQVFAKTLLWNNVADAAIMLYEKTLRENHSL